MKKVIWSVLFLAMAWSCLDPPDCIHTNNDRVGIVFRTMFDGKADTVLVKYVTAAGTTEKIYDSLKITSSVDLPLNYLSGNTAFDIETLDRNYLLDLGFIVKPQFVSPDCPERFILSDLRILQHSGMDSIRLVSSATSNPAQQNISIYRCPRNTLMKLSFRQWYMDTLSRGKLDTRALVSVKSDFSGTLYSYKSTHTVYLPLNLSSNQATYTFKYSDSTTNAITVQYQIATQTLFSMCPNSQFPTNLVVTQDDFEIIHMRRDSIYDPPKTNIETFRCPITNRITAIFKSSLGFSRTDTLNSITADYLPDPLYLNLIASNVVLPLNPAADNTVFNFEYKNKTCQLTVGYTRKDVTYHSECGVQEEIKGLTIVQSTGFTAAPKVTQTSVSFPTVPNLEIVK